MPILILSVIGMGVVALVLTLTVNFAINKIDDWSKPKLERRGNHLCIVTEQSMPEYGVMHMGYDYKCVRCGRSFDLNGDTVQLLVDFNRAPCIALKQQQKNLFK